VKATQDTFLVLNMGVCKSSHLVKVAILEKTEKLTNSIRQNQQNHRTIMSQLNVIANQWKIPIVLSCTFNGQVIGTSKVLKAF
jgi:hypothetical protein